VREIKFRAWDKDKERMNYNIQNYYDNLGWGYYPKDVNAVFGDFLDNEYQEVMQYTGLKDKNGVESYFDDLVKWDNAIYQIIWDEDRGIAKLKYIKGKTVWNVSLQIPYIKKMEVIGNIYENPELLKELKDGITSK